MTDERGRRGCREEEAEGRRGTQAGAGDWRTTKVLAMGCEFKGRGGGVRPEGFTTKFCGFFAPLGTAGGGAPAGTFDSPSGSSLNLMQEAQGRSSRGGSVVSESD